MPRNAAEMASVTACRGPFSAPRDGRILTAIRYAYIANKTDVLPGSAFLEYAFAMEQALGKLKSWHYESLRRGLRKVATPLGRRSGKGAGKGRPEWWKIDPAKVEERGLLGQLNRKRARQGLPPIEL
jgi:hypothetical protein